MKYQLDGTLETERMLFCGSQTQQWECDHSLRQCRQP